MIKPLRPPRKRAAALLAWYDAHRRELPWRTRPGERPDPYAVWLSEVMLQQTTVATVKGYFERFLARWPTVEALAAAPLEEALAAWAGLGYYARARNLHACAIRVATDHGGRFPATEDELRALPGLGPYTAAAVAAIAFDAPCAAVDGNVERVMTRLHAIGALARASKRLIRARTEEMLPASRAGDYAQALMDLGATICTPRKPACALCPLNEGCTARAHGTQETFPRKAPKKTGTLRRGAAFVVTRGDELLVRTRPAKGLLGGMTEVPGSHWQAALDDEAALAQAPALKGVRWHRKAGTVTHVFTHFPLELVVYTARVAARTRAPDDARWVPIATVQDEALPNLMRKVIAHGLGI
jgi:A/G-specific adenine glycosylase